MSRTGHRAARGRPGAALGVVATVIAILALAGCADASPASPGAATVAAGESPVAVGESPVAVGEPTAATDLARALAAEGIELTPPTAVALGSEGHQTLLFDQAASSRLPLASLTKLITALVVLDAAPLAPGASGLEYVLETEDESTSDDLAVGGAVVVGVRAGDRMTERQLLECMLVPSGADCAFALARAVFGSHEAYRSAAQQWVAEHRYEDLVVLDPAGVAGGNQGSAASMLRIAEQVLADPVLREIVRMPTVQLPRLGEQENTNPLLGDDGVIGIKTGTLGDDWRCLAFAVDRGADEPTLLGVILGAPSRDELTALARALIAAASAA